MADVRQQLLEALMGSNQAAQGAQQMPPLDASGLTPAQIAAIRAQFADQMPNNIQANRRAASQGAVAPIPNSRPLPAGVDPQSLLQNY